MTEAARVEPAAREPQMAVAPLSTIATEDVGTSAAAFDQWLRRISHNHVTLARLSTVAGTLPVMGNLIALSSVVVDVARIVDKYNEKATVDTADWAGWAIDLIGVVPGATSPARMALRPTLHMVRQKLAQTSANLGEESVVLLTSHMNETLAGELDAFAEGAIDRLDGMLVECADFADKLIGDLIDVLQRSIQDERLFDVQTAPPAEKQMYDPMVQARLNRMFASMAWMGKKGGHLVAADPTNELQSEAKEAIKGTIAALRDVKGQFRSQLGTLGNAQTEQSVKWLLKRLLDAARRERPPRTASINNHQGAKVQENRPGSAVDGVNQQAPASGDANSCKACPAPQAIGGAISLATGCESFTHTDFVLTAPLPIEWSRTYRSNLAAYDQGSFGARWITPYSSRIDVLGQGKKSSLVYHGADGRSHHYPWLAVGETYRDAVEEITLIRWDQTLLTLDFGKPMPEEGMASPWRESYELVDTVPAKAATQGRQHFRLAGMHASSGAAIGLRYDHLIEHGPYAGEYVLSDILSKQGDEIIAHVGTQPDVNTGLIRALWELRDDKVVRQLAAYTFDAHGDLVTAQDENLASRQYSYQYHLVTRYTDRTGRGTNLQYDGIAPTSRAVREWGDDGSFATRLEWDRNIRLTYVTDALGQETRIYYDILGYTYRVIHPDQREEWFFRDEAKNITRHVHPDGSADNYRYDSDGNLQKHIRADGTVVHFEYDPQHRMTGVMDAEGGVWRREYDIQGNLTEETDPRGMVTSYVYDQTGRPIEVTDAKGGVKKLSYTAGGQLAGYTDCSGKESRWDYDERGRLSKVTNAAGHVTRYCYTKVSDAALAEATERAQHQAPEKLQDPSAGNFPGQLESITYADGTTERLCHDAEGRLLTHRDAMERSTTYRYASSGLIEERIDALGQRLGYKWDGLGRLKVLLNENDQPYTFQYDPVGRLLSERAFDDKLTEYVYSATSGVLSEVREPGVATRLEFDPMGRLRKRTAALLGLSDRPAQVESFGYDGNGRLVQAHNQHAKVQWFYDEAGNVVREHHHYLTIKQTALWQHHYDETNERVGTVRPGGHSIEWLTYGAGHAHGLMIDGQEVVGFERDDLHREVVRVQGNGLAQRRQYDPVGRLVEQQVSTVATAMPPAKMGIGAFRYQVTDRTALGKSPSILRQYRYDKAGQLTSVADSRRGQINYRYDPVGRLLAAASALGPERFAFDPASNMLDPSPSETDRPITSNRVLDNLIKEYAGTSYRYDERGNLVERLHNGQPSTFTWDAFGRIVQANTPQGGAAYAYDALGRRIIKYSEARGKSIHTVFGWDGDTLAFESNIVRNTATNFEASAHTVHYIYERGSFVPIVQARRSGSIALHPTTDVKALMEANDGNYDIKLDPLWNGEFDEKTDPEFTPSELAFYQCDHLGTPQELTDSEGHIVWSAQYRAWGLADKAMAKAKSTGWHDTSFSNPIRFQGQYFDEETGLHYNRYRYYDPYSGRYTQSDPIGLAGGTNTYAYVAGNPLSHIDPRGLDNPGMGPYHVNPNQYGAYPDRNGIYPLAPTGSKCVQDYLRTNYGKTGAWMANSGNIQQYIPSMNEGYAESLKTAGEVVAEKAAITKGPWAVGKAIASKFPRVAGGLTGASSVLSGAAEVAGAVFTPFGTAAMDKAQHACTLPNSTWN